MELVCLMVIFYGPEFHRTDWSEMISIPTQIFGLALVLQCRGRGLDLCGLAMSEGVDDFGVLDSVLSCEKSVQFR